MGNFNIQIDLTKLAGARVMDITRGETTRKCVVIPIDNDKGTVADGYTAQTPDGLPTTKFFSDVKLSLVAIEYKTKRHGVSHGLKPGFSPQETEKMTPEEAYAIPWVGVVRPWRKDSLKDADDLPADDAKKGW